MYQAFKDMPTPLKFLTTHALACFALFLAAVIPGIPITFHGEAMESQEIWAKGAGIPTVAVGLAMPVMAILFLLRWQYCRQLYSVVFVSSMIMPFLFWQELSKVMFGMVISCAIVGYLFMNRQARAYFSS